jgi:hypothetical protein
VRVGDPLPAELRQAEVHGAAGVRRLGDLVTGATLLVFLRHFG